MAVSVSLQGATDEDTFSVTSKARDRGVTPTPVSVRELVTPQFQAAVPVNDRTWANWVGDHEKQRKEMAPSNRRELVEAVVSMVSDGDKVRAVGSGHSHSNAPEPPDTYVDLRQLTGLLESKWLKSSVDDGHLVRLKAGTQLRDINRNLLADRDLALKNMGSFDTQTIAGAVNTSTHGTGIGLASIADAVRSVEMVVVEESASGDPVVRLLRVEPDDGPTDPEAFVSAASDHHTTLIQDDELFRSVVVGYGCMGIVYAYTLEVRDFYWLREESKLVDWNSLKDELTDSSGQSSPGAIRNFLERGGTRHCQILVNLASLQVPHTNLNNDEHDIDDNPVCLVRRHYELDDDEVPSKPDQWWATVTAWAATNPEAAPDNRWPPERRGRAFRDASKAVGNKIHPFKPNKGRGKQLHNKFFHPEAEDDPFVANRDETAWYIALRRLRDRNNPEPEPPTPTPTTEVAVPLDELVEGIDDVMQRIQNVTQDREIIGAKADVKGDDVFFFAPMGVRFTAASEHYLSPEYDRTTAMIEVPMPVNEGKTKATWRTGVPTLTQDQLREYVVEPALEKIEAVLVDDHEGRPHMGKHNTMDRSALRAKYPRFDAATTGNVDVGWLQAYDRFNAFGTFNNKFTNQLGIDR